MPDMLITFEDLWGKRVSGAIWADASKPGCKWVVPGGEKRYALVHRDARTGKCSEVAQ